MALYDLGTVPGSGSGSMLTCAWEGGRATALFIHSPPTPQNLSFEALDGKWMAPGGINIHRLKLPFCEWPETILKHSFRNFAEGQRVFRSKL